MITTKGQLYQWDTGRIIEVTPITGYKVDEIQVYNGTTEFTAVLEVLYSASNKPYAKIPDALLQSDNNMDIWVVTSDAFGEHATEHKNVSVLTRVKPSDYVYTEEEIRQYDKLEKRIEALEKNGTGDSHGCLLLEQFNLLKKEVEELKALVNAGGVVTYPVAILDQAILDSVLLS